MIYLIVGIAIFAAIIVILFRAPMWFGRVIAFILLCIFPRKVLTEWTYRLLEWTEIKKQEAAARERKEKNEKS